jgi:hypothetical protein
MLDIEELTRLLQSNDDDVIDIQGLSRAEVAEIDAYLLKVVADLRIAVMLAERGAATIH